jgi:hypothetical protein
LDVDIADIKPHILYPWQTIQDVGSATPHIDKFLAVAQAKNVIDKPLPVCFDTQDMCEEAIHPRQGKIRPQARIDLHCGLKDFEEGFEVRVAEEAITPQIVSIYSDVGNFFPAASSSRSNGEGSFRSALLTPLWTLARQVFKRRGDRRH